MGENTALGIDKHWNFNQHPNIMNFTENLCRVRTEIWLKQLLSSCSITACHNKWKIKVVDIKLWWNHKVIPEIKVVILKLFLQNSVVAFFLFLFPMAVDVKAYSWTSVCGKLCVFHPCCREALTRQEKCFNITFNATLACHNEKDACLVTAFSQLKPAASS